MYQEVCFSFNRGTKAGVGGGGGVNVGHSLSPPSHFMLATGLNPAALQLTITLINVPEKVYFLSVGNYINSFFYCNFVNQQNFGP